MSIKYFITTILLLNSNLFVQQDIFNNKNFVFSFSFENYNLNNFNNSHLKYCENLNNQKTKYTLLLKTSALSNLKTFFKKPIILPQLKTASDTFIILTYYKNDSILEKNIRLLFITNVKKQKSIIYYNKENLLNFKNCDSIYFRSNNTANIKFTNKSANSTIEYLITKKENTKISTNIKMTNNIKDLGLFKIIENDIYQDSDFTLCLTPLVYKIDNSSTNSSVPKWDKNDNFAIGILDGDLDGLFNSYLDSIVVLNPPYIAKNFQPAPYCKSIRGNEFIQLKSGFYSYKITDGSSIHSNYLNNTGVLLKQYMEFYKYKNGIPRSFLRQNHDSLSSTYFINLDKKEDKFKNYINKKKTIYVKTINPDLKDSYSDLLSLIQISNKYRDSLLVICLIKQGSDISKIKSLKIAANLKLGYETNDLICEFERLDLSNGIIYNEIGKKLKDKVKTNEILNYIK